MGRRRRRASKAVKCVLSKTGRKKGAKASACHNKTKSACKKSKVCKIGK